MIDNETLKAILEQRINLLTAPLFQPEDQGLGPTSKMNLGLRGSYEKPKTSAGYNAYSTNQYQMPRTASTREISYKRSNSLLNGVSSPKQVAYLQPFQSPVKAITSPKVYFDFSSENNQTLHENRKI